MISAHEQDWVKVNVRVDKGVMGIVSALSNFHTLETIESCEGGSSEGPWVIFYYGISYRELSDFVLGFFAPNLYLYSLVGDDVKIGIRATPSGYIYGELSIRLGASSRVEKALKKMLKLF